jgi:hypothetical protein
MKTEKYVEYANSNYRHYYNIFDPYQYCRILQSR